jgi:hypothetical protein
MKRQLVDLNSVNPQGRVDVLAYRGAEYLTKQLETQYGLSGIWDNLQPHVNRAIARGFEGFEIPTELKVILSIIQANMKRSEIEGEKKL